MLEKIFELVRKEEMIIFAGAGFSKYSGYPSGLELADLIFNSLTTSEKEQITRCMLLPDLAEEYVSVKSGSRHSLITLLKRVYGSSPKSIVYHDKLCQMPQIKTIITTNYDTLFETAFKDNCEVIYGDRDCSYINKRKVMIYKIHGDTSRPDSVIITRKDYTKLFDTPCNDIMWSVIKSEIVKNNVLFVGYSLEDPNIESFIRKIIEKIGDNRKEFFLIAPNLNDAKVQSLNRQQIQYVNLKAEQFIDQLEVNIKENIFSDFRKQYISIDTFNTILSNYNLQPQISGNQLSNVIGINKPSHTEIKFSILQEQNKEYAEFIKQMDDYTTTPIKLNMESLRDFSFSVNGLRFADKKEIKSLEFIPIPKQSGNVDLYFDNGFEYVELPYKIFGGKNSIIVCELPNVELKITLIEVNEHKISSQLYYKIHSISKNLRYIRKQLQLLECISTNGIVKIFANQREVSSLELIDSDSARESLNPIKEYYNNLEIIEKHFNVRFLNFDLYDKNDEFKVQQILTYIKHESMQVSNKESFIFKYDEKYNHLLEMTNKGQHFSLGFTNSEILEIELHNLKFSIGYEQRIVPNAYVENYQSIMSGKSTDTIVKDRDGVFLVSYVDELEHELE